MKYFVAALAALFIAIPGVNGAAFKKHGVVKHVSVYHVRQGNDDVIEQDITLSDESVFRYVTGGCEKVRDKEVCQYGSDSEPVSVGDEVFLTKSDNGRWSARKKEARASWFDVVEPRLSAWANSGKYWETDLTYVVNPATTSSGLNPASKVTNAVQEALARWQPYFNHELIYGGTTTLPGRVANDGMNMVYLIDGTNGTVTCYALFTSVNGKIVDTDVRCWTRQWPLFGADNAFSPPPKNCTSGQYLDHLLTHEAGHMLGLLHSAVTTATMYATYNQNCQTSWRSLEADDRSGIASLYPSSTVSPPNAIPTIYQPTNGQTGVAVDPATGKIRLRWRAVKNAAYYQIYQSTVNPPTTVIGTVYGGTNYGGEANTYYFDATNTPSQTRWWKVVARNGGGSTVSETWSYTTAQ